MAYRFAYGASAVCLFGSNSGPSFSEKFPTGHHLDVSKNIGRIKMQNSTRLKEHQMCAVKVENTIDGQFTKPQNHPFHFTNNTKRSDS